MKKSAKGFTMMEMIVVVAIIGILSGVLAPAMASYIRKSRISQQESNARTVYNAVQTQMQELQFEERDEPIRYLNGQLKITCEFGELESVSVLESGSFAQKNATTDPELWALCEDVVGAVGRLFSDQDSTCWCVYTDNYIVHAAGSANSMTNRNVGFCPKLDTADRFELSDHTINDISQVGLLTGPAGYIVNTIAW